MDLAIAPRLLLADADPARLQRSMRDAIETEARESRAGARGVDSTTTATDRGRPRGRPPLSASPS
jgi:hypothetical protein